MYNVKGDGKKWFRFCDDSDCWKNEIGRRFVYTKCDYKTATATAKFKDELFSGSTNLKLNAQYLWYHLEL